MVFRFPVPAVLALSLTVWMVSVEHVAAQEPVSSEAGTLGLYRFPDLHGDIVVFSAEGDLWQVPLVGGLARRLTTHPAEERVPRISPDGTTVAFSAEYEGPTEVYTMPISGGASQRWTYEANPSWVTGWAPSGELLYTTTAFSTLPRAQMVRLEVETGMVQRIPLSEASEGIYDDAGASLFFVRPAFHGNVTKRYTGGTARNIWRFDEGSDEAVEITGDYVGESHSPLWWNGRVYFVSDRDGTMNLWSMTAAGEDARQETRHSGWDVKNPSIDRGRIIYQLRADLWVFDIASEQTAMVPIRLASDRDQLRERWVSDPLSYLTSAHIHPKGESVVLTARGRVFVAPAGPGRLVRASVTPGVRFRETVFMPEGDDLLGLSDATGELEWVTLPASGIGLGRALTDDGEILRFQGLPSPNGDNVAYTDQNRDLWILSVATGGQTRISGGREGLGGRAWSPDSRWLVFEEKALNSFFQLFLYDTQSGESMELTSDRINSRSPTWGPNGDFLYFLSDRHLVSLVGAPWGTRQPEPYFEKTWEVYEIALRAGLRSPFQAPDELHGESADEGETEEQGPIEIEIEGLTRRLRRVPVDPGNYRTLVAGQAGLFLMSTGSGAGARTDLLGVAYDFEVDVVTVVEGIRSTELSADGKKLLVRKNNAFHILDARPSAVSDLADSRVDLSGWGFSLNVQEDWRQIFVDAWRMERDYFYDPGMHGVDWTGVRDKYLPLVDRVATRDELSDVIGRVVGELSALHTSVRGGDERSGPDNVAVAALGARLVRSPDQGGYRIDYIYQSDPDYPEEMSPLADPSLALVAGDVIEAVNGVSVFDAPHIGSLLRNQAGRAVRLQVRDQDSSSSRDVMVTPLANEQGLKYSDWEYTRRLEVEELADGQVGYVHLRAMGPGNLTEWYRQYYPVYNRGGLIIDVRRNRGGNIDAFILEKLMRETWMWFQGRVGEPYPNMHYAPRGHLVVLVDQTTASDGEAFADGFRRLGLGKVIGMRTWGGEIWLSSVNRLSDGGLARAPMTGVYSADGSEWLIEQKGVIPDIVVDNLPHATFNGQDAQLEAAVAYLLDLIENDPRVAPDAPAYPDRGFRYRAQDGPGSPGVRGTEVSGNRSDGSSSSGGVVR